MNSYKKISKEQKFEIEKITGHSTKELLKEESTLLLGIMIPNYNKKNFKKDPFILSLKIDKNNSIYLELSHRMTDAIYYKITYEGLVSKIDFKIFNKASPASS